MVKKPKGKGALPKTSGVSKNQRDVTSKPAKSTQAPRAKVEVTPGEFTVPGGKIILDKSGVSRYEGTPAQKIALRKRYTHWADDHDARGQVKQRLGK